MEEKLKYKILIVDDSAINRSILADILGDKFDIIEASDGIEAIKTIKLRSREISLILLDLVMPNMDGLEVLAAMNKSGWIDNIPVMMISSENSPTYVERAYELGASDFISRPFNVFVVRKRVANTIMLYAKQKSLVNLLISQIYEKEKNSDIMLNILSHIVEFRNGESGLHILHINKITEIILRRLMQKTDKYKLSAGDLETIVIASSLHDIGKISVPDEILNKPGRLTVEEFEVMKKHTQAGADMLEQMAEYMNEPLVIFAHEICLYHHERYDGKGYPCGLKGEEIPISAQIVAIADVYDALTSERCYKSAIPHNKAIEMIMNGECGVFNPILLECLNEVSDYLKKELKVNSSTKRSMRDVKRMTDEMLRESKISESDNSINHLEHERIKYEFFASMSNEIQFEYTVSPSILTISEWCANKFGLPQIIVNPTENERLAEILGGSEGFKTFETEALKTDINNPIVQFSITININSQMRLHRVFCRADWSSDGSPKIMGIIGKIIDIEEEHQAMLSLAKKASVDTLTGVYNRGYAETVIKERLENGGSGKFALVMFDVDDFKSANDTYGHLFGDRVLKMIAESLKKATRKDDIVARIGGDEFLLFFEYNKEEDNRRIISRIHKTVNGMKCDDFNIRLSMGIAITPQVGYDYNVLVNSADMALYHSKRTEKGICSYYNKDMKMQNTELTPIEN